MGSNSSAPKLQARQQIILRSGVLVNNRDLIPIKATTRTCTLGFAVNHLVPGRGRFNQGYLIAGSCAHTRIHQNTFGTFVIDAGGFEVLVGKGMVVKGGYDPKGGRDYAIVKIDPDY